VLHIHEVCPCCLLQWCWAMASGFPGLCCIWYLSRGRVGSGRARGADPIMGPVLNVGGVPCGLGALDDLLPSIGGRSANSGVVPVSHMGSSVIRVHPSRNTTAPLPLRSSKAGIDVMLNLVINDCPCVPIELI
jgi:hypothetical protein